MKPVAIVGVAKTYILGNEWYIVPLCLYRNQELNTTQLEVNRNLLSLRE